MNGTPPTIPVNGPAPPKIGKPLHSKHLVLGAIGVFVAGAIAATLFWMVVWFVYFAARAARAERRQAQVQMVQPEVSDESTIAEIDAAAQLSFENNKLSQFSQIAVRSNLGPDAQVHLIDMAFKHLSFEKNQMEVLTKLIENPAFSPAAKARILANLNRISFETNKQALLGAINRRESER